MESPFLRPFVGSLSSLKCTPNVRQNNIGGAFLVKMKYSYDMKLNAVLDVINKGLSKNSVASSIGASTTDIRKWVRMYKYHGPDGLKIQNKKYSGDFKVYAVEYMYTNNLSSPEASARLGIPSKNPLSEWERIYNTQGPDELRLGKRGRNKTMIKKVAPTKDISSLTEKELIKEVQRLQMENEYLKKLNALIQKREKFEQKTK